MRSNTKLNRGIRSFLISLVMIFIAFNSNAQTFTEMTGISLPGITTSDAAWGDYDNDGDLDLIMTGDEGSYQPNKLYKNNGNGSFTDMTAFNFDGLKRSSVDWGDYDGDGYLDLIFSGLNGTGYPYSHIFKNNGGTSFTDKTAITLEPMYDGCSSWADFDNDGDLDLLFSGYGAYPRTRIYKNNGNGTFSHHTQITLTGVDGSATDWGDYDNDGDLDLLLTGNTGSSYVSKIYRNDGYGILTDMTGISLTGVYNGAVDWGDYDSDGDLDIVLTGSASGTRVSKIYRNDGSNTFNELTTVTLTPIYNSSARWGDFDNDGDLDLLMSGSASSGNISKIYQNNGSGSFAELTTVTLQGGFSGSVNWMDYDNDKDLDIMITGNNGSATFSKIYKNNTTTANTAPATPSNLSTTVTGRDVTFKWNKSTDTETAQNGLSYNIYIYEPTNTTYSKSPHSDTSSGWRKVTSIGPVQYSSAGYTLRSLDTGSYKWSVQAIDAGLMGSDFAALQTFNVVPQFSEISTSFPNIYIGSTDWGDFDNDNDLDLLITGYTGSTRVTKLYRNDGSSSFTEMTNTSLPQIYYSDADWGDYDNDGDLDLMISGYESSGPVDRIYRNDGSGSFTSMSNFNLGSLYDGKVKWADYDNDGYLDLLIIGFQGSKGYTKLFRNEKGASFTEMTAVGFEGVDYGDIAWGDYDNDADLDLLLTGRANQSSMKTKLYRNDGSGAFTDMSTLGLTEMYGSSVDWGDYDSDGDLDILINGYRSNTYPQQVSKIYRNDATSGFTELTSLSIKGVDQGSASWGDYDNDGDLDFIISGKTINNATGEPVTQVYKNEGSNVFMVQTAIPLSGVLDSETEWADYDNDGDLDFIMIGKTVSSTYITKLYKNNEISGNSAPGTPTDLATTVNVNDVTFSWTQPTDDRTSQNGLSYNIYIGSTDSTTNLLTPMANKSNGFRKVVSLGNTNLKYNNITLKGLAPGTYYWSVQAIDNSFKGGTFATAKTFKIESFSDISSSGLPAYQYGSTDWGDFDNDGDLDLLATGMDASSARNSKIFRNNGNTTFTEMTSISLAPVYYSSSKWGDFDNDNDLDILICGNSASGKVSKIYRNDGSNTFTELTALSLTGVEWGSSAWGDADNDGDLDILITGNSGSTISKIYKNEGSGAFTELTSVSLKDVYQSSVSWMDYDNDGDKDIFLSGYSGSTSTRNTSIYRNNGAFSFTEMTGFSLTPVSYGSNDWSDFDGDGDLDLLLTGYTNSSPGYISKIYRNDGGTAFTEQTSISLTGVESGSSRWGDFNNDGDADILLTGYDSYSRLSKIYINNGSNSFTEKTDINLTGMNYCSTEWADIDNDGDLDFFITGATSASTLASKLYRGNYLIKNNPPATPTALTETIDGYNVTLSWTKPADDHTATNSLSYNVYVSTNKNEVNKMSPMANLSTGFRKLVSVGNAGLKGNYTIKGLPLGKYYWSVQAIDNSYQGGSFSTVDSFEIGYFQEIQVIDAVKYSDASASWGDYDNDGDLDLLFTGQETNYYLKLTTIYRNNGDNTFNYMTGIQFRNVYSGSTAWGDYDNDGDLDFVLTGSTGSGKIIYIYKNTGNGYFSEITIQGSDGVYNSSTEWGDYDNDGDLDLLVSGNTFGAPTYIYYNYGNDKFYWLSGLTVPGVEDGVANFVDANNDGYLDIFVSGYNSSSGNISKLYKNNGDKSFSEVTSAGFKALKYSKSDWGDYDMDGDQDLVLAGSDGSAEFTKIYRNNGSGSFSELTSLTLPGVKYGSVKWGDCDNDGDLDLLINGQSGSLYVTKVYMNGGSNNFTEMSQTGLTGTYLSSVKWGDFDKDGDLDIVIAGNNGSSGILKIYKNICTVKNNPPDTIAGLTATMDNYDVTFSWNKPTDDHTSSNGLTYNVYLSTSKNTVNKVSPLSDISSGFRRVVSTGNSGSGNSTFTIKTLPAGKYYWSAQALDNSFIGSAFTPVDSFTIIDPFTEMTGISITSISSGSAEWGDIDNDGDLDLLASGYYSTGSITKLYRNDGSNVFTDLTSVSFFGVFSSSAAWGDYDNDGDLDLILAGFSNNGEATFIYRNNGSYSFTQMTNISLTASRDGDVAWVDFDNDGDQDVIYSGISGYNLISKIYRNDGSNVFTEMTAAIIKGIYAGSLDCGDYDNDGDQDILITGNSAWSGTTPYSRIYRNNGSFSFTEMTAISLTNVHQGCAKFGDYDSDGDLDIALNGDAGTLSETSKLYKNNGSGSFTEVTSANLIKLRYYSKISWGDYDNDGDLDILMSGYGSSSGAYIARNEGSDVFTNLTSLKIPISLPGPSSFADYDNDGDLDIIVSGTDASSNKVGRIYRNNCIKSNNPPSKPTSLSYSVSGHDVTLSWAKTSDDNTAQNGLTYNLFTGTSKNGVEKLSPLSNIANGYRKVVGFGNANFKNNGFTVKNLSGPYYWGVQAVDNAFKGGEFATDSIFIKYDQSITFTLGAKAYGDADFNPGATATSILTVSYSSSDTNIASIVNNKVHVKKPGTCFIYADQAGNSMYYAASQVFDTLFVSKAIITVTADNKNKTYSDANPTFTITYSGFKGSDGVSVLDTVPTATCTATQYSNTGTYSIIPSGGGDNNYSFSYVNGTLTIGKATLTATADNKNKTYGDANPTFTITYSGFKGSDGVSVLDTVPTANCSATQYSNKGTYSIIPANGGDNNYSFSYVNGTMTIGKATLTATADNKSKTYGDANPTFTITYSGFKGSDGVSVLDTVPTATCSATQYSNKGTYNITPANGGDNNYSFSYVNGTLTIGKATLTATADNKNKTYGDANPTFTITYSGFKGSDNVSILDTVPTATCSASQYSNTGTFSIIPAGGGDNNYSFSYANGTLTIGKATLTATADNKSKTYGDVNPTFTITYSGFIGSDGVSVLDTVPAATCSATQYSNTGTYNIVPSGGGDNNYSFSYANGTLTINKATLTATADNKSKTYGDANPTFTITYSGFKGTDGVSVLDTVPTATCSATQYSNSGNYNIIPDGGGDNNYTFSYVNGTLTIGKATLTATSDNKNKTYGDANPTFTITYSGFKGTDGVSVLDTVPIATCSATQYSNKGTYNIIPANGGDNNYSFSYVNGTLTIGKATLTATADNKNKTYGDVNPTFTITYSGFKGTDGVSVLDTVPSASTTATQYSNNGMYSIVPSGGGDNNYTFSYVNGTLTIGKAILTVTVLDTFKTYGDDNPIFTLVYSGFIGSDDITILTTLPIAITTATKLSKVDTFSINLAGGADDNYSFNYISGTLTIKKAMLTAKADDKTTSYGVLPPQTLTISYSGFIGSDTEADINSKPFPQTIPVFPMKAGIYTIFVYSGNDDNYDFNRVTGVYTILKAGLLITADDKTKNYGDPNPTLTITYNGFVLGQDQSVLDTLPSLNTAIKDTSLAGFYPNSIIVSGGSDSNYSLTYENGDFTINAILPSVKIDSISNIAKNSAICYSQLTSTGGTILIQKGVCWSLTTNPTIADSHSLNGTGVGSFIANMSNLLSLSTYYVRPYATNSVGTVYGTELSFTTLVNSIEDEEFAKILLYPNPVNNQLFIELPKELLSCHKVEVIDQFGKIVYSEFCNSQKTIEINTEQFSRGVYLVRIKGERSYLGKFLKI